MIIYVCRMLNFLNCSLESYIIRHTFQTYLFCFCLSLSFFEEEPKCCPFSSSSPAAFSTLPCTEVGSLAIRGATSHTPLRSEELKSETGVTPQTAAFFSALTVLIETPMYNFYIQDILIILKLPFCFYNIFPFAKYQIFEYTFH